MASSLGPRRSDPAAAGVIPGGRLSRKLQILDRHAGGVERRQRVGLGIEDGNRAPGIVPALGPGRARAHTGRHQSLALGRVVAVLRPDLEERAIGDAPIGVAPRRIEQIGQDRGPHDVEIGADRIEQFQAFHDAAEISRLFQGHEGIGHGFDQAARSQRPPHETRAALRGQERRLGQGLFPRQGDRRDVLVAVDAQHLLDETGLALDIGAPGGRLDREMIGLLGHGAAEILQNPLLLARRQFEAAQAAGAVGAEAQLAPPGRHGARDADLRRLAAAQLEDEPRRDLDAGTGEFGIEAALEAVARVALQIELAAGRGGAQRIEQRASI